MKPCTEPDCESADCSAPVARRTLPPWWEYQEEMGKIDLAAMGNMALLPGQPGWVDPVNTYDLGPLSDDPAEAP